MQEVFAVVDQKYCVPHQVDLVMEAKVFTLVNDQFKVYDRTGQIFFQIQGKVFSYGHRRLLLDKDGNEIVSFRRKYLTLLPTFACYYGETELFLVEEKWCPCVGISLSVVVVNKVTGRECKVALDGNFMDLSFRVFIKETNQTLAVASRNWTTLKDTMMDRKIYMLSVLPGVDAAFVVLLILAIAEIRLRRSKARYEAIVI